MKSGKKLKKSDAAQRAINWFHDSPGAKVSGVAKRFGISIPYAYKLREKAAGKSEADAREWNAALLSNEETTALFDDLKTTDKDPIDDILDSRATDYGTFADNSRLAQALKRAMADHASDHGRTFADDQWEALEMIASKMSRIVNGNSDKVDNWDDIAGYAKLISDRLRGTPR